MLSAVAKADGTGPAVDGPPHSLEAERAALGSVLIRGSALDDLGNLDMDDFFLPAHREIVDAMRTLAERGRPIDPVTLGDELNARGMLSRLDGGAMYLTDLYHAVPTAENAKHYAGIVADMAIRRRLIAVCADLVSQARGNLADAEQLVAEARDRIESVAGIAGGGPAKIGMEIDAVVDAMEQRGLEPEKYSIMTGLEKLDHILGGMRPDNVIVVAANPSRGKTALAWNTAIRVALRGVPVLVFSLEMSTAQLIERGLAFDARVNGRAVMQGTMNGPEWQRVLASQDRIRPLPIWIDDRALTDKRICSETRRWRARRRAEGIAAGKTTEAAELALVVIDYLGLVRGEDDSDSRRAEVAAMSRRFKLLTKKKQANLPVILCAQLNRENMKDAVPRQPRISDLRDAGEIEQDADVIIFPWWEGDPPLSGPHPALALVKKNRNGPTGEADLTWEREFMTFSNRDMDADHERQETLL